jgi:hypothetical protein
MPRYTFTISNGEDFSDIEELSDDETAWKQAVQTVRDIESTLPSSGGNWSLVVSRDGQPLFQINLQAQKLR